MGNRLDDLAGVVLQLATQTPTLATAATAKVAIGRAPFAGKVVGSYWVPESAISGAASNNRYVEVQNAGSAGAGTTQVSIGTYTASVDAVAYDANALTASGTAANLIVAEGDVLTCVLGVNGTGLPAGRGQIVVELQGY